MAFSLWLFGKRRTSFDEAFKMLRDNREDYIVWDDLYKKLGILYKMYDALVRENQQLSAHTSAASSYRFSNEKERYNKIMEEFSDKVVEDFLWFISEFKRFIEDKGQLLGGFLGVINGKKYPLASNLVVNGLVSDYIIKYLFVNLNPNYNKLFILNSLSGLISGDNKLKFILDQCRRVIKSGQESSKQMTTKKLEGFGLQQQN